MYEVTQFYSDWIIEDPRDGSLISAPSTSPENRFFDDNGNPVASCLGSAMDQQVIAEVFDNYIHACDILDTQNDLLEKVKQQREALRPGFVIGSDGRILEWDREYDEPEPGHRHMSQLYGFHPGSFVTQEGAPEIISAVRNTLDYRLANGGAGTGWSRAWLINCSARLLDGNMAHEHIQLLLQKSMFKNLFDTHPPFQIDGNFGYTAGIAEMLVQSHEEGVIKLLPALPDAWPEGSISGLCARGGYELSLDWKSGVLKHVTVHSDHGGKVKLISGDKKLNLNTYAGETILLDW
jgi:alpha-L-fucosidase 2